MTPATSPAAQQFEIHRARSQADFAAKIPTHLARMQWNAEQLTAYQEEQLRALLARAQTHSPFHAERLTGVDPAHLRLADLAQLPTMTKTDLMASFDAVVTDRRLRRADVEAHLAATREHPSFLHGEYLCLASGGSSGQRGIFVWHWSAASDYLLAVVRSALARLQAMGGTPPGGVSAALVAADSAIHATRACAEIFSGEIVRLEPIPSTLPLADIVARLNAAQPALLLGYAQLLGRLADEQLAGRLQIAPASVTGTSEMFSPELKAKVGAAFAAPVVDSFGSSEGLIGTAAPGEDTFTLAGDLAIVELVDEQNQPVTPGTPSARVLLTSLLNHTQPLIRYELSDRMVQQPAAPDHGHLRVTVDARADELFRYGKTVVHPFALRAALVRAAEVSEYQVRQTATGVDVAVVAGTGADLGALTHSLQGALQNAGLPEATVTVAAVDAVAQHPRTGKVQRFIPRAGGSI